jgi:starch-binding outer membrane protein, SusD/RagB family
MQLLRTRGARLAAAGALALGVFACDSDRLTVPDYNNPSSGSISSDPLAAIRLLGSGVLYTDRNNTAGYVLGTGILGREAYNYTGTEGRNTTGWLTNTVNQSTSFGSAGLWAGFYQNLRQIKTLRSVIEGASEAQLTDAQRDAARGFALTMDALTLHYELNLRDSIGVPVEVGEGVFDVTPFLNRDSVYGVMKARLDSGATFLSAAGTTALPVAMHAGFTGFTAANTFRQFNRAIAARINAYRASPGNAVPACQGGQRATCYQEVLTNLSESFINPTGALDAGVNRVYSTATSEVQNGLRTGVAAIFAHARTDSGVQLKANGSRDDRFTAKIRTVSPARTALPAGVGISTANDFLLYPSGNAPIPIIKNEELILLRAEARWYTGDQAGALADINTVRTRSGGLAAIATPFANEKEFVDELLYNRRFSLLFEGHRWIDMRRFGRLDLLTIDLTSGANQHFIAPRLVVPQAECLARRNQTGALAVPANSGCASA